MPEKEAYAEALRRIREAEETGAVELDLSGNKWEAGAWNFTELETLNRLPPELAGLTSLQSLNLSKCRFCRFAPLESLLLSLKELYLTGCELDDLPPEVCGEEYNQNVVDKVRAHYEDLKAGQRIDAEVKVLFLGNGGAGKTQLCRRLRVEPFDQNIPTTHGVQLGQTTVELDGFPEPVRLNLWDFGGQDYLSRITRAIPSWAGHFSPALDA
jgi:Leucine-rich repeat (LRR) protein